MNRIGKMCHEQPILKITNPVNSDSDNFTQIGKGRNYKDIDPEKLAELSESGFTGFEDEQDREDVSQTANPENLKIL